MRGVIAMVAVAALGLALTGAVWAGAGQKADAAKASPAKVTLKVEGMDCGGCALSVKMAAKDVSGVTDVEVSVEKGAAEIAYDPDKSNPDAIAKAITKNTGFKTVAPKPEKQ